MSFYAYILECADGSYYTGHTDNLQARLQLHVQGLPGVYTSSRLPVILVWSQEFPTRLEALEAERQIKGWSRAKKKALIRGDWDEVSRLAQSYGTRTPAQAEPDQTSRGSTSSPRTDSKTSTHPTRASG